MSEAWTYIARAKEAGKHHMAGEVVAAIVDCPALQQEIPKTVAKWMREGCTVERVPVEWVRKHFGSTEPYSRAVP